MHPRQVPSYIYETLKFTTYQMQVFWGLILSDGGLTIRKANGVTVASFVFSQSIRNFPLFHISWIIFRAFLHGDCDIFAGPNQRISSTFSIRFRTRFFPWLGVFADS